MYDFFVVAYFCGLFNICLLCRCGVCDDLSQALRSPKYRHDAAKRADLQNKLDGHHIDQSHQRMKYWRACARAHRHPEMMMTILFDWMTASRAKIPQLRVPRKDCDFKAAGSNVMIQLLIFSLHNNI
jgi:hypothetical protein